jgi:hypothetical protein
MAEIIDLREFRRFSGEGLVAYIGGEFVDIVNISAAGIRMVRPRRALPRRNVEFSIADTSASARQVVAIRGHIVGETADHVRVAFASVNQALAKLIRDHQSKSDDRWGPPPP